MQPASPLSFSIRRYRNDTWESTEDIVSQEVPVTILLNGYDPKELWAWPDDLEHLIIGHVLLDMGGLNRRASVEPLGNNTFAAFLEEPLPPSSDEPGKMNAATLMHAMQTFMEAEGMWDNTGCFHRAGAYHITKGKLIRKAEDIGRHNCVDRLAGWAHETGIPLSSTVLLISARITASLCAKAIRAGFRYIISRSAITTAAIDMAQENGVTLVGFARDKENRFTIFSDTAGRVLP